MEEEPFLIACPVSVMTTRRLLPLTSSLLEAFCREAIKTRQFPEGAEGRKEKVTIWVGVLHSGGPEDRQVISRDNTPPPTIDH